MAKISALKGPTKAGVESPCNDGLPELNPPIVMVPSGFPVTLRIVVCGSPAMAAADLDGTRFLSQTVQDDFMAPVPTPELAGDYLMLWMLKPLVQEWTVQTEVLVGKAVLFRQRKTDQSSFPVPKWAVWLRVK